MKKISLLIVCALFLSLSACAEKETKVSDSIVIGLNYELSEEYASYGNDSVNGIKLAVKDINAAGGINGRAIELDIRDNKSKVKTAKKIQNSLVDKSVITLGPTISGISEKVVEYNEDENVPIITNAATGSIVNEDSDGSVYDYSYRTCFSDIYQGKALGEYAYELGNRNAIILEEENNDYSSELSDSITKAFEEKDGKIIKSEKFDKAKNDYSELINSIKDEKYDCIYLIGYYQNTSRLLQQLRSNGINKSIFLSDSADTQEFENVISENSYSNIYYSTQFSILENSGIANEFISKYKTEYNKTPNGFSASGYDLMMYVAALLSNCEDDYSTKTIDKVLNDYKYEYQGICGVIKMNKDHSPEKNIKIVEYDNGTKKKVETIEFE